MTIDLRSSKTARRTQQEFPTTILSLIGEGVSQGLDIFHPEADASFSIRGSDQTGEWDVRMRHHEFRGDPTYSRVLAFDSLERCLGFIYDALVVLETLEDHNGE